FFYTLSAGMILLPYLLSAAYFAKLTFTEPEAFKGNVGGSIVLWRIFGIFGVVYSFFLAWASGAVGLTIMSLLYAPGILMYIKGKKERGEPYLKSTVDKVVVAIILIAAATSLVLCHWAGRAVGLARGLVGAPCDSPQRRHGSENLLQYWASPQGAVTPHGSKNRFGGLGLWVALLSPMG
ncbi:MAG: hypothetical protein ACLSVD_16450, partial [Eggerthellaceae bacterium]